MNDELSRKSLERKSTRIFESSESRFSELTTPSLFWNVDSAEVKIGNSTSSGSFEYFRSLQAGLNGQFSDPLSKTRVHRFPPAGLSVVQVNNSSKAPGRARPEDLVERGKHVSFSPVGHCCSCQCLVCGVVEVPRPPDLRKKH